jgi:hypothetical protein
MKIILKKKTSKYKKRMPTHPFLFSNNLENLSIRYLILSDTEELNSLQK